MNAAVHDGAQSAGEDLVIGLGRTGLSLLRHLAAQGAAVRAYDTREVAPCEKDARELLGSERIFMGEAPEGLLDGVREVFVSPGVPLAHPVVQRAVATGIPVSGDIELFARHADAPVAAVTGSNGKSTVASLLALMVEHAGRKVRAGGNLGTPALDLLGDAAPDLYVLELSSFQLERTRSLRPAAAALLNIAADHLDHHGDLQAYADAKARIFRGCEVAIWNRDDTRVTSIAARLERRLSFGLGEPPSAEAYGIVEQGGGVWLARGEEALLPVGDMRVVGRHNLSNALAALAMGSCLGLADEPMLAALRSFVGLPHRMTLVLERSGRRWIDDSKATNVGATCAAIEGLDGDLVMIMGGLAKGQDLEPLRRALSGRLAGLVVIGEAAAQLEALLGDLAPTRHAGDMRAAVAAGSELAEAAGARCRTVLLSPACASQDMFVDYQDRGRRFADAVTEVLE